MNPSEYPAEDNRANPPAGIPASKTPQWEWRPPGVEEFPPRTHRRRGLRRKGNWVLFEDTLKLGKAPMLPRDPEDEEPRDLTLRQSFFIMLFAHIGVISGIIHFRFWENVISRVIEWVSQHAEFWRQFIGG